MKLCNDFENKNDFQFIKFCLFNFMGQNKNKCFQIFVNWVSEVFGAQAGR